VAQLLQFDERERAHPAGEAADAFGAAGCGEQFDVN
jgi:hypothetical protein